MAAILKHWREAATLLLVSKSKVFSAGNGKCNFECLMLKRSGKSKFMPSIYVFPGGIAHESDFSQDWLDIFNNVGKDKVTDLFTFVKRGGDGSPMFSRKRPDEFSFIPSEIAFRICAIRETFEESGILLARNIHSVKHENLALDGVPLTGSPAVLSKTILVPWRKKVDADAWEFIRMCRELEIVPDVWALYEWSNWLTPILPSVAANSNSHEGMLKGRRYDTAFFMCVLDHQPEAAHDEKETVASQWSSPVAMVKEHASGKLNLAPPQMIEIGRLLNVPNVDELHRFAWQRSSQRVDRWLPVPCLCEDGMLYLYPGDDLYPAEPDFEGHGPIKTFPMSVGEVSRKYPNHNRTEITLNNNNEQIKVHKCNIDMSDGQIRPVLDWTKFIPVAKL
ncbi:hypothetical protein CHS0354_042947 [Potamilus streckersoni]|uniref:Nudix hydrolase domain-containing protein n=1 Tax=Potamilus streckersoni TaxID=2493646 RepID=A0AAE0T4Z8_9BIVA|nr:hypothetical protein CHS0354_042947 [Potamilus streckersoni]